MSDLVNPATGLPFSFGKESKQAGGQLIQLAQGVRLAFQKIQAISQQQVHLGLFVEYMQKQMEEQGMTIDPAEYTAWAQVRWDEIQAEAKQYMEDEKEKTSSPLAAAESLGVDLGE